MLTRLRRSMDSREAGFTLIELLVVMIIIGILAAIAIPVFLNQRKKGVDTAAKADVSTIGKEVATYYVDGTTDPTVAVAAGRYQINAVDVGKASSGVTLPLIKWAAVPHTGSNWCVQVSVTGGTLAFTSYSAANGLQTVACP